jgi:hypothetical protein
LTFCNVVSTTDSEAPDHTQTDVTHLSELPTSSIVAAAQLDACLELQPSGPPTFSAPDSMLSHPFMLLAYLGLSPPCGHLASAVVSTYLSQNAVQITDEEEKAWDSRR